MMNAATKTIRDKVHALADQLPANATWDDVLEEVRLRGAVEAGIVAAERGEFATDQEVKAAFSQWGVTVED